MSGRGKNRFWRAARPVALAQGFTVELDGRAIRTPAKAPMLVPTLAFAQAVAAEWDAQKDRIRPETMPLTRAANSAIDKVTVERGAVVSSVAAYGATDLLCYRAARPEALVRRQSSGWDPILAWAEARLHTPLKVTTGVVPVAQPPASLARLHARVDALPAFQLTALSELVALSGSLLIGLAVTQRFADPLSSWVASRIDEIWEEERWGKDAQAGALAAQREAAFFAAERVYRLSQGN